MDELRSELLAAEERFWLATGGDVYREHMIEDGRLVFPFGTLDRSAVAAMLDRTPAGWVEWTFDDVFVIRLGEDVAVLGYRTLARHAEEGEPYQAMMTSVYVRRADRWLLAVHQQTPVEA
jgi:hypothetical protein